MVFWSSFKKLHTRSSPMSFDLIIFKKNPKSEFLKSLNYSITPLRHLLILHHIISYYCMNLCMNKNSKFSYFDNQTKNIKTLKYNMCY